MAISLGDALLKIGIDKKDFDNQMKGIGASLGKHQKAIGVGMTAAGATILAGLGVSMKAAADFEGAMRSVNTMMGLSQEEFTDFSKEVQALAANLGVSAVDSAKALYQAISAGVPKENVLTFLEIATKAAIGGMTDTETAVDGLTTVINAFKLPISDAQRVADIMFTTVKGGKTTFDELSASIFQVAPIAAASGVKFEEVAAALATMTKQGVPTKIATTQLRQAMVSLSKPTADMNKVIQELGYESGQTMLEELGLAETLNVLRESTGGSNEMLMKMFGSVEAGQAVLALTGRNAKMFTKDLAAMDSATGAATDAFEQMEESTSRQMAALKASFMDIAISIGNVLLPILKDIVDSVKPIIENIRTWMEENPELSKTIVIAVAVIGGLLAVLGPLLIMLPAVGAAFTMLLGPVGIVIAAIAALIAIGVLVWKNWDKIKEKAKQIWNSIVGFFKRVWAGIVNIFKKHWDKILAILFPAVGIPILIARNWGLIVDAVKNIWNKIVAVFSGMWKSAKEWGMDLVRGLWSGIQSLASWIWNKVSSWASDLWSSITGFFGFGSPSKLAIEAGENIVLGLAKGIEDGLKNLGGLAIPAMPIEVAGGGVSPTGPNQMMTLILEQDGKRIARTIMPYVVGQIRLKQGVRI